VNYGPGRCARYYDEHAVYVCLLAYLKTQLPTYKLREIFCIMLSGAVPRSSSDVNGIRYVLPGFVCDVMFPIMGPMACMASAIYT